MTTGNGRSLASAYVRRILGVLVLLGGCAALFSPVASAESLCTDSWVGPAEGEWSETASWSAGWVPTSTDVACIGAGKTVKVTGGAGAVTGVVQGAGTLIVQASSLEIASSLEPSVISSFTQTGGTLTGAGSLQVSSSLSWTEGTMAGSGQTVVKAGAVAIMSGGGNKFLATRTLTNEGTMTLSEGQFWVSSGARIDNVGTFIANSEYGMPLGSGEASIVNTGTFEKASGAGTTEIGPSFESSGTIDASVGELRLNKSLTLSSGKLEGKLYFAGLTTATNVKGEGASVTVLSGATFSISSGDTIKIGTFTLNGGFVGGAGTLEIILPGASK